MHVIAASERGHEPRLAPAQLAAQHSSMGEWPPCHRPHLLNLGIDPLEHSQVHLLSRPLINHGLVVRHGGRPRASGGVWGVERGRAAACGGAASGGQVFRRR